MRMLIAGLIAGLLPALLPAAAFAEDGIVGVWLTEDRDSKIEFAACGDELCGRIVWLLQPEDENGMPYKDTRNPDPALRERPILGLTIFEGVRPTGDEGKWRGTVYNPEDGDSYKTFISLLQNGGLKVKGCILGGLICDSSYWTKSSL